MERGFFRGRLALALLVVAPACAERAAPGDGAPASLSAPATFERRAMGVLARLDLRPPPGGNDADAARALAERAFAEIDRLEALVNLWSAESALSRWNAEPAGTRRLPAELEPLVERALAFAEETGGAFDPTVGLPLRELGFYGGEPVREPGPESARVWAERTGHARVRLVKSGDGAVLEGPAVELDLSAMAKGVAADRVLALLREAGVRDARVAVGTSSIAAMGEGPEPGRGWPVELPMGAGAEDVRFELRDEALSTSGQHSLRIEGGAEPRSHLFDPRTLAPVDHRTEMVAVRGPLAADCDMASTALLVMGVEEATAFVAAHPAWTHRYAIVLWSAPEGRDPALPPEPEITPLGRVFAVE